MNALLPLCMCLSALAAPAAQEEPAVVVRRLMTDLEHRLKEWDFAASQQEKSSQGMLFPWYGKRRQIEFEVTILVGRLGNVGPDAQPAVPLLCRVVREHGYPFQGQRMAEAAAEALGKIGDADALEDLAGAVRFGQPELREKALKAIEQISPFRAYLTRYERPLGIAGLVLAAGLIVAVRTWHLRRRCAAGTAVQT